MQSDDEDGLMYRANKEMWKFDLEKQRWSGPDVSLFVCLFVCLTIFNEEAYLSSIRPSKRIILLFAILAIFKKDPVFPF